MPARQPVDVHSVALGTLKLLVQAPLSDLYAREIERLVEAEAYFLRPVTLPPLDVRLNERVCAEWEAVLSDFLPTLPILRETRSQEQYQAQIQHARELATKLDAKLQADVNYWSGLVDFLCEANSQTWYAWRQATFAQKLARNAIRYGEFERAKNLALFGLQRLSGIPDKRLYLHLASRLQCALATGESATGIARPLGEWIVAESEKLKFHLLAAGMAYNLGNQQILSGHGDTDASWLERARKISERWKMMRDMEFYRVWVLERLALIKLRQRKFAEMKALLDEFVQRADDSRATILYHQDMAAYSAYTGDLDAAIRYIKKARDLAMQRRADGAYMDRYNAWAAQITLGCFYTKSPSHSADEAIATLDEAHRFARSQDRFLNDHRRCSYHIFSARAWMKKGELSRVRDHLDQANQLLAQLDAPRHQVRAAMLEAQYHCERGDRQTARAFLEQAKTQCSQFGIVDYTEALDELEAKC